MAVVTGLGATGIGVALLGVPVPGAQRFPGATGPTAFLVVGGIYVALAALFAATSIGVFGHRRWSWQIALVANALTLVMTLLRPVAAGHVTPDVVPFLVLATVALVLLASPAGRTALRRGPFQPR